MIDSGEKQMFSITVQIELNLGVELTIFGAHDGDGHDAESVKLPKPRVALFFGGNPGARKPPHIEPKRVQ